MGARATLALALAGALLLAGCGGEGDGVDLSAPAPPFFPADYASTYKEVRNCRQSVEHDLNFVRILADPAAYEPYSRRDQPFPEGAVVLKEEYDLGDSTCSGPLKQWTAVRRLAPGGSATTLDWQWEQVDAQRHVVGVNTSRCYGCHASCTPDAGGYESTCAVP